MAFRVLFGLVLSVSALRFIHYGWIDGLFVDPSFRFRYFGFEWVPVPTGAQVHALFWVVVGLGVAVAAGFLFRLSALLLFACFATLQLIDVTNYLNHYYLACLLTLLLALSPAGKTASVDSWLGISRAQTEVPRAWHWLLRVQVGVVYTFAGLAKATSDWLIHAQPLRIWLNSRTDMPVLGPLFAEPLAAPVMSWCGFLFDTTIVWFLLWRRTRVPAYLVVIAFHTVTRLLFPIGMFPFIMVLGALVFFPADWPRALVRRARGVLERRTRTANVATSTDAAQTAQLTDTPRSASSTSNTSAPRAGARQRLALGLGLTYCAFQVLMPLRHLAYGGNVLWDEQGMRFSWRVMVREKNGSITYIVRDTNGKEWHVPTHKYLTRLQERELAGQPDLILQLGHHIARDFAARGYPDVSVQVDALVSLNGRRLAPLIDPEVDLTTIRDGVAKAHWILPAPKDPPPHIKPLRAETARR